MQEKTMKIIAYGVGIAALIGIVWLAATKRNTNNPSAYSASALTAAETFFDFGAVRMDDGNVSHKFELKNEGTESVRIERAYTSCMCTTAAIFDSSGEKRGTFGMPGHGMPSRTSIDVGPGESVIVEAIFDPAAHGPSGVGKAERSIYLGTNSAKSPKVELHFTAMVTR